MELFIHLFKSLPKKCKKEEINISVYKLLVGFVSFAPYIGEDQRVEAGPLTVTVTGNYKALVR